MRQTKLYILLLVVVTFLASCSQSSYDSQESLVSGMDYTSSELVYSKDGNLGMELSRTGGTSQKAQPLSLERKLIKTGYVNFKTESIETTRDHIFQAVEKYQGYISSDQEYSYYGGVSNTLIIRVPAEYFDSLLSDSIEGIKKLDTKDISVRDVTEEFFDVETRINTKKELEARYLEILKQAESVTDILAVERELGTLRADIESMEGRLNYLSDQISLSTLNISFYQEIPEAVSSDYTLWGAIRAGLTTFIGFLFFLIELWPFILLGAVLITVVIIRRKRRK